MIGLMFVTFYLQVAQYFLPSFKSIGLSVRRRSAKYIFMMVSILDFRSEGFSLFFDLQVTLILPTKFQVNWPFGSEVQNRFSR